MDQVISQGTKAFLTDRYPLYAADWIDRFPQNVEQLCDRWQFTPDGYESGSRFGAILYGVSETYGRCAMKLIPYFCERLETEIACYRMLPYREMCAMYDCETEIGALLLQYVESEPAAPAIAHVFEGFIPQRRRADDECVKAGIPRYERVLATVTDNALREIGLRGDETLMPLQASIVRAKDAMKRFRNHDRYLIHGDIHRHNMIVSGGKVSVIDPLGYIAPFAFEFTRFLGTEIKEYGMTAETLAESLDRMRADILGITDVTDALGIDTTLRACNTFIEGDTIESIRNGVRWARDAWRYGDEIKRKL